MCANSERCPSKLLYKPILSLLSKLSSVSLICFNLQVCHLQNEPHGTSFTTLDLKAHLSFAEGSASAIRQDLFILAFVFRHGCNRRYSLVGFVSHVGKNTGCGHYVAHIRKDGRWVIFDDRKVHYSFACSLLLVIVAGNLKCYFIQETGPSFSDVLSSKASREPLQGMRPCIASRISEWNGSTVKESVESHHPMNIHLSVPSMRTLSYVSQVAESEHPPLSLGYLYLFKRDDA